MVFDWLKKKLTGKPEEKREVGLDARSVERLTTDLEELDSFRPGTVAKALAYVLHGDELDILHKLPAEAAEALRLRCVDVRNRHAKDTRTEFFEGLQCRDASILVRLGKLWEAASRAGPRELRAWLPADGLEWLEVLLTESTAYSPNSYPHKYRAFPALSAEAVERMLEADGKPPELLQRAVFFAPLMTNWYNGHPIGLFGKLPGFSDRVKARPGPLREALAQPEADRRVHVLKWMAESEVDPSTFVDRLSELAVSTSKQVREHAETFLRQTIPLAKSHVERLAREAGNDERIHAIKLLWRLQGQNAHPFLAGRLAEEKNKRVIEALRELLPSAHSAEHLLPAFTLPPVPEAQASAPLKPAAREALKRALEKTAEVAKAISGKQTARIDGREVGPWALDGLAQDLAEFRLVDGRRTRTYFLRSWPSSLWKPLEELCAHPDIELIHVLRLSVLFELINLNLPNPLARHAIAWVQHHQWTHPPGRSLREIARVLEAVGMHPGTIGLAKLETWVLSHFPTPVGTDWEYFAEHLDVLHQPFQPNTDYLQEIRRRNALAMLADFPRPPEDFIPLLWDLALGSRKEGPDAQAILEKLPETRSRIVAALGNGKSEFRATAAEWLARLRETSAVDTLLAAVKKEKNEVAKGAFMSALEGLGVPVEQFLDRKALADEARKGLAKGAPSTLEEFPFNVMPLVHWVDDGSAVDPEILRWFIVQACKLKDPEPGVLLRRYAAQFKNGEREAFGEYVLSAWLDLDVAPISRAEAEKRAQSEAQMLFNWSKNPNSNMPQQTLEEYYAAALPRFLHQPKGSAIDAKGVLAVAGACGGPGIAPQVSRFLKQWYGVRGAQSKALVQMLAWVEHPTAIQLVLAVGNRFRTKGIQDEAARQAQLIADRKGWTLEELADRTIPSAGLDENGEMKLDYGARQFTARLGDNLEIALTNAEGKVLTSLPDPRAGDDEELAKEAKKQFSASKKELKSALKMQADRLYEAMCIQRSWTYDDWDRYLNRHPLVRHLFGRLIWLVQRNSAPLTFRPLSDGTLTDVGEATVTLAPEDEIRLAHDCNTPADVSKAWGTHFADYEVEPLFQQFGRPKFTLSEDRKQSKSLDDFLGHVLDAFALRGRATKLGYTRGQAQDGGWFFDYHKRFPTLSLEAVIEFTGNGLPEENRKVALKSLSFSRTHEGADINDHPPLGEIPSVLLAESWNDLRSIATEGSGFDPEWEKKTEP